MEYLTVQTISAAIAVGVPAWWLLFRTKPENKLMKTLELKNKAGKYPHLLDKTRGDRVTTYVYWVPDGIPFEVFTDPKSKVFQTVRQSLGDMHRVEVLPIDGHKIAIRVILEELKSRYDMPTTPADKNNPLVFALGESMGGTVNLKMGNTVPHVCIAGSAGSGKSVCLRGMITSLILHPRRVNIWLIDLKGGVEFQPFQQCARVSGYAKNAAEGIGILTHLQAEMVRRNELFFKEGVNSIDAYNKAHPSDTMKRHVLFIDEFAEYAKEPKAKDVLKDLARRARSCGIHMVVATQRPDADVLDGQIRANMPAYICFMVTSSVNSQLVLGHGGAEQLPGNGRCILRAPGQKEVELQGYCLEEDECRELVKHTYVEKPTPRPDTKGVRRK